MADCAKCGGKGFIECYGHIAHGVCFKCNGTGEGIASVERKQRTPVTAERKSELAAIKTERDLAGTIDDSIARAIQAMSSKPAYKAEIGALVKSFVRSISVSNVTLSIARTEDDKLSRAIYRMGK